MGLEWSAERLYSCRYQTAVQMQHAQGREGNSMHGRLANFDAAEAENKAGEEREATQRAKPAVYEVLDGGYFKSQVIKYHVYE